MTFHYMGKFSGNPDDLPCKEAEPNAVPFKEPDSPKKLALIANGISIGIFVVTITLYFLRLGGLVVDGRINTFSIIGIILSLAVLVPHEYLHALCFKEDVYMYNNLKQGMLFVVGPERMSKGRFIFMSLLPNLVFGFIPFILFMIFIDPENQNAFLKLLGSLGAFAIPMGAGDYMNVFNAITQMPKGAKTYLYKFSSHWYMPADRERPTGEEKPKEE